jgi:lysophospholipase L1-like esterase
MSGWGAHLGAPLNARLATALRNDGAGPQTVAVLNVARGGATTESHREEGLWAALLAEAAPGDVVLLQFGHNDQKRPHLAPYGGYTTNLHRACDEVLDHGARPVLCTPVGRRHFADGTLVSTHGDYPQAVRNLAMNRNLPLIDLTRQTEALYSELGEHDSMALFTHFAAGQHPLYPDGCVDDTHFSFTGAVRVADLVAADLVRFWLHHGWTFTSSVAAS